MSVFLNGGDFKTSTQQPAPAGQSAAEDLAPFVGIEKHSWH
jgi:hypothetical protein